MDPLYEEEILAEEPAAASAVSLVLQFLSAYGWHVACAGGAALYALHRARPALRRWRDAREDALYHKDPDRALAREAGVQRARDKQQQDLAAASERALQLQRERDEQKRLEAAERMRKYGAAAGDGQRLGSPADGYMPLAGGAPAGSYRAPRRSACGGGGCGR